MKRRQFITATAAASAGALGGYALGSRRRSAWQGNEMETVGGLTPDQLVERYRVDLFRRFLPNMERYVIDHDYGGFMCDADIRTGKRLSTNKRAWYEGRGIWLYSFLYNHLEKNPGYLETARRSVDFIMKHRPEPGRFWNAAFTREGQPLPGAGDIFGNLYIAEGLVQYAKASGDRSYLEMARQITLDSLACYDRPDYSFRSSTTPGSRLLNHWMVFLFLSTALLEQESFPEIESLADRCVDAIMNRHMNREYGLLNYSLTHDLARPSDPQSAGLANVGLGIQSLWMVMFEARRRNDPDLFQASGEAFIRHVQVAQDPVYGGCFGTLDHVNSHSWTSSKALGIQEEVLIGTLYLAEQTGEPDAWKLFAETDTYVRDKFARPDYKFWISSGDRKVEKYNAGRVEHYHHPRHLMLNLLAVERLVSNSTTG